MGTDGQACTRPTETISRADPLRAEVIATVETPLADEWRELAVRRENPFALPEWHAAWLETHPAARPVVIAAWRENGELAGVIPLVRTAGDRWLGVAGAAHVDWFSPACDPADEPALAAATAAVLDRLEGVWRIDRCLASDAWLGALRAAVGHHGRWVVQSRPEAEVLAVAPLSEHAGARGKTGSEIRRHRRRIESQTGATFRRSQTADEGRRDLDALLELHAARWGPDHFDAADRAFQHEFARRAAERGWLRLWVLEAQGRMAAATYGWRLGATSFGYLQAFDEAFAKYRPGMVIAEHAVEEAADEGCAEFNMLRGSEHYKHALGGEERTLASASVVRRHTVTSLAVRTRARGQRAWRHLPERQRKLLRGLFGLA
jgi:CelD/BcsL family acetyltransferase involved in cellulose biosynthesis